MKHIKYFCFVCFVNKYCKLNKEVAPSLFLEFHGSVSALNDQVKVVGKFNMQNIFVLCNFVLSTNIAS